MKPGIRPVHALELEADMAVEDLVDVGHRRHTRSLPPRAGVPADELIATAGA